MVFVHAFLLSFAGVKYIREVESSRLKQEQENKKKMQKYKVGSRLVFGFQERKFLWAK